MVEKRIIFTSPIDGKAKIVIPAYEDPTRPVGESDAVFLERLIARTVPAGVTHAVVDVTTIPSDRTFREAYTIQNEKIVVDMPKARNIHMSRIREVRDAELKTLDVPYMKALEAGDTAEHKRIAILKQTLRDIPQKCDLSVFEAPEKLKAFCPKELKGLG